MITALFYNLLNLISLYIAAGAFSILRWLGFYN